MIGGMLLILIWTIFFAYVLVMNETEHKGFKGLVTFIILITQYGIAVLFIVTSQYVTTKVIENYQQNKYVPEYTIQGSDTIKVVYTLRKS